MTYRTRTLLALLPVALNLPIQLLLHESRDGFARLRTVEYWRGLGLACLVVAAGIGLIALAGVEFWRFAVWFDAALARQRARIERRAAAYHAGRTLGEAGDLYDSTIDG